MTDESEYRFRIRVAKASDARILYSFLFARPDNHMRRLTLEDVIKMIRERVVHIAECWTERAGWDMAGACYIAGPSGDPPEFELGGAYVAPEYRGFGIFRTLAVSAIVNHLALDAPLDSGDALIAHVHLGNAWPRTTLETLGFAVRDRDVPYRPDAVPGLDHMPVAADGCIHADTYAYPPERYLTAAEEILNHPGQIQGKDGQTRMIAINVPMLEPAVLAQIRDDVRTQLTRRL
jgi:GNAT superfamily N-acetyltransferase